MQCFFKGMVHRYHMLNHFFSSLSVAAIAIRKGSAHIVIGFDTDAVPLRFVYHQFFSCCISKAARHWLSLTARRCSASDTFNMKVIMKVSDSPMVLQRCKLLCMSLIEIPLLHSKLSTVSAERAVLCNYSNRSFKSSGAVKYSHAG